MTREAIKHKLEFMREMNDKRTKPAKTASELAREGCSCGNCSYRPELVCTLKAKAVRGYNICESWK